jgi:hypothetical protein
MMIRTLLLYILLLFLVKGQDDSEKWILRIMKSTNVRLRADSLSGVVRTVCVGSVVEASERWQSGDGQLSFKLSDGWISVEALEILQMPEAPFLLKVSSRLGFVQLRDVPDKDVVRSLYFGEFLDAHRLVGEWFDVGDGWVHANDVVVLKDNLSPESRYEAPDETLHNIDIDLDMGMKMDTGNYNSSTLMMGHHSIATLTFNYHTPSPTSESEREEGQMSAARNTTEVIGDSVKTMTSIKDNLIQAGYSFGDVKMEGGSVLYIASSPPEREPELKFNYESESVFLSTIKSDTTELQLSLHLQPQLKELRGQYYSTFTQNASFQKWWQISFHWLTETLSFHDQDGLTRTSTNMFLSITGFKFIEMVHSAIRTASKDLHISAQDMLTALNGL